MAGMSAMGQVDRGLPHGVERVDTVLRCLYRDWVLHAFLRIEPKAPAPPAYWS